MFTCSRIRWNEPPKISSKKVTNTVIKKTIDPAITPIIWGVNSNIFAEAASLSRPVEESQFLERSFKSDDFYVEDREHDTVFVIIRNVTPHVSVTQAVNCNKP